MATISDISIIDSNKAPATEVASGLDRVICSPDVCGSKKLTVVRRTLLEGRTLDVPATDGYQLLYVMETSATATIAFEGRTHSADEGAGVLLVPGESATIACETGTLDVLHMSVPKPPAGVEEGLPGGPGYFFNRDTLRALSDASGGRVRRFCAESSVRLEDGKRLTPTNAIQAGEMHYNDGGSSPYHMHNGTAANPDGADHCYMTFKGRGKVEVGDTAQEIEPGTLVYFPPGVPHRLRAHGGTLDYFEIQAWRSFKTNILSEEPLGLRWYYEQRQAGDDRVEWNQS
jgi:mannose-6-phosphate isomerase-like protein (cupin superfamily)